MLDIQFIRDNRQLVEAAAKNKKMPVDIDKLLSIDDERRSELQQVEELRRQRNELAAAAKGARPTDEQITAGKQIKDELARLEGSLSQLDTEFISLLKQVPNVPTADTPIGLSEEENVVDFTWGEKPSFDFTPKNHWELAEANGWIDKERATKVTGARFAYIKGPLVQLQLALMQFITNTVTDEATLGRIADEAGLSGVSTKPFTPVLPPLMIKTEVFDAMDRLEPRDDRYKIEGEELWLQGSAEHVLGSMHMQEVLPEDALPIRYIGYAASFRKEAGSYGKDMEGIIRMHQFDKMEMESLTTPESALGEHKLMIAIQEYILRSLKLPYQRLLKCTYDIGKPNARGVDMETWLPGQNKYRETHTADYMTDYQARRLQTRFKRGDQNILVYINDATALAMGRGMVAIMENYQTSDGKVRVPEVLKQYMGGREYL